MRPIALVAGVAFLALAAPASAQQQPVDTTPTVAADGIGFATLTPDLATFAVAVRSRARTSAAARDAANRTVAAVVRLATEAGVAADDIRTVGLTVSRERVRARRGRPAFTRYNARQFLTVRVRDLSKLSPLLDAVADAGADIEGPEFGFADPSAGRLLATRAALADARRRADDAAATQGLRITGVRSVVLAPDDDDIERFSSASAGGGDSERFAAAAPTRVSPGSQQFVERVRVVYTAAPA
jgi:uncharacterized protein YggE